MASLLHARRITPLLGYLLVAVVFAIDTLTTVGGAIAVLLLCALAAAVAGFLSWRKFVEVREEVEGDHDELVEVGHGRTRFVALWGVYLGGGFALTTLVTLVAFLLVPRCLG